MGDGTGPSRCALALRCGDLVPGNDLHRPRTGMGRLQHVTATWNEMLAVREYLNHGGGLLYTGQWAGATENNFASASVYYDPVAHRSNASSEATLTGGSVPSVRRQERFPPVLAGRLPSTTSAEGSIRDRGTLPGGRYRRPLQGHERGRSTRANSAQNQVDAASFITTSSILQTADYPAVHERRPGQLQPWDTGVGGPFAPFGGDCYLYSQQADISYKRLMRSFTMPVGAET